MSNITNKQLEEIATQLTPDQISELLKIHEKKQEEENKKKIENLKNLEKALTAKIKTLELERSKCREKLTKLTNNEESWSNITGNNCTIPVKKYENREKINADLTEKEIEEDIKIPCIPYEIYVKLSKEKKCEISAVVVYNKEYDTYLIPVLSGNGEITFMTMKKSNTVSYANMKNATNIYENMGKNKNEKNYDRLDSEQTRTLVNNISFEIFNHKLAAPFGNEEDNMLDNIQNAWYSQVLYADDATAHMLYGMLLVNKLKKSGFKWEQK